MEDLLLVLFHLLSGVVISLVVLLPPLRRLGRDNHGVRIVEIAMLAFVCFTLAFIGYSRVVASAVYLFGTIFPLGHESQVFDRGEEIVQELWVRFIVPPPLQSSCYTSQVEVCEFADRITGPEHGHNEWGDYLIFVGWCLIPAFVSGVSTWFFTRKPKAASLCRQ